MRGAWLVGCVVAAAVTPASIIAAADPRLKPGVFLYAAPGMGDPNFAQSVVLLVEYNSRGAMGLVIDRPTEVTADQVLTDARTLRGLRVHWGGPVQPEVVFGLARTRPSPEATRVIDGVFLIGGRRDLEDAARGGGRDRVRLYSGYTGWGAGQLESEFARNGWVVGPGSATAVFSSEPSEVWPRVYRLLDERQARGRPGQAAEQAAP